MNVSNRGGNAGNQDEIKRNVGYGGRNVGNQRRNKGNVENQGGNSGKSECELIIFQALGFVCLLEKFYRSQDYVLCSILDSFF